MTDQSKKYLSDILKSIELVEEFVNPSNNFNYYNSDKKTQSAVERQLGIIGEAVNKYNQLNKEKELEYSAQIIGMRNRIIHSYDNIDSAIIWAIIKNHLPKLKKEVIDLLK